MTDYDKLPEGLRGGVANWIQDGIQPGGFLSAVIENDLKESFGRADDFNRLILFEIVQWFYWEAPGLCWGSVDKARAWAERFGRKWDH